MHYLDNPDKANLIQHSQISNLSTNIMFVAVKDNFLTLDLRKFLSYINNGICLRDRDFYLSESLPK